MDALRGKNQAAERVWRALPGSAREQLETALAPTDLQSLLLAVADVRASRVRPADLVARWRRDRFVKPSASDPRRIYELESGLWRILPDAFVGIELSPVAPMGSCRAVGPVSQNRVVTTMRLGEVVSDAANVLAIEAAVRRLEQPPDGEVDLAASHRLLRAQVFGPDVGSHFRLFTLVSSARDTGSARTEARLLHRHLSFWTDVLERAAPDRRPQIELTVFNHRVIAERLADTVLPAHRSELVKLVEDPGRVRGRGYYTGLAMRLAADDGAIEVGDGGFTTWTAQLMGNAKERCLVSCVATERLIELAELPRSKGGLS
jgi:hypothetical protein